MNDDNTEKLVKEYLYIFNMDTKDLMIVYKDALRMLKILPDSKVFNNTKTAIEIVFAQRGVENE